VYGPLLLFLLFFPLELVLTGCAGDRDPDFGFQFVCSFGFSRIFSICLVVFLSFSFFFGDFSVFYGL